MKVVRGVQTSFVMAGIVPAMSYDTDAMVMAGTDPRNKCPGTAMTMWVAAQVLSYHSRVRPGGTPRRPAIS